MSLLYSRIFSCFIFVNTLFLLSPFITVESAFEVAFIQVLFKSIWCTKRVKSTDTGRPVFQKYESTRKNTGRPVNLRVDPYFRYGSTRIFAGRPVYLRVHPYFTGLLAFTGRPVIYGSTRILRVDPYLKYGSTRKYTDRPAKYGSTRSSKYTGRPVKYGSTCNLRVDPYYTGRPVFSL